MTHRPGIYMGNDHGGVSGPNEPYITPFLDQASVILTGSVTPAAGGFWNMQYAGPYVFSGGYEYWGPGGPANFAARAYAWASAHPGRQMVIRTGIGFAGANATPGFPVGKAAYDAVAAGQYTATTNAMVDRLFNAGPGGGMLPYAIIDPWWESGAYWFTWAQSNMTGPTTVVPRGYWLDSVFYAYRKYISDAKAREFALTGTNVLKFGYGYAGDATPLIGVDTIKNGPTGEGSYPGNSYIDYITPDIYSPGSAQQFQGSFSQIRAFAEAHGKPIVIPEFGWFELARTTEASDLAFLQAYAAEAAAHPAWQGFVHFNTYIAGSDSMIIDPYNQSTPPPVRVQKPNAYAYFKNVLCQPINQAGVNTPQLTNVTWSQINASTVRVTGNATNDILNVEVYSTTAHTTKLAEGAPVAGLFTIDVPNVAVGGPYPWDVAGRNVPSGSAGPPTPAIIATFLLSVTVIAAPALTLVGPSTSGNTRTIPFTATGGATNVTAYEPPFVKTQGTNDVAPVAGAGTIVVTNLPNGTHTITLYSWTGTGPNDPNAQVVAIATDTFTISATPLQADDFEGGTLNTGLWTIDKPDDANSTVVQTSGKLLINVVQLDETDNTVRANNASISVGSPWTGGYDLASAFGAGTTELLSNGIHFTNTTNLMTMVVIDEDQGTPDMRVSAKIKSITHHSTAGVPDNLQGGVGACWDNPGLNGYVVNFAYASGNWHVYILEYRAGAFFSVLATSPNLGVAPAVNDVIEIEVIDYRNGTRTINAYWQGSVVATANSTSQTAHRGLIFGQRANASVDLTLTDIRVYTGSHQIYTADRSVGAYQTVTDSDFEVEEEFDTRPNQQYEGVGFKVWDTVNNKYIFFELFADNTGYHFVSIAISAGAVVFNEGSDNTPILAQNSFLVQLKRVGNVFSAWTANADGTNRVWHGDHTFALTANRLKLFADTH